jgi:23S rRNA (uracil1939-C5)-methyltransferase
MNFLNIECEPICEHFGVCGGCKWQNMKYSQQLYYKQNEVLNHLQRIGKLNFKFESILGSENSFSQKQNGIFVFEQSLLTERKLAVLKI